MRERLTLIASKSVADFIQSLTVSLGCRLISHCLPVISVLTGAHSNHEFVAECGEAAFMVYRKIFLDRKQSL